jgi:hypothetical protein
LKKPPAYIHMTMHGRIVDGGTTIDVDLVGCNVVVKAQVYETQGTSDGRFVEARPAVDIIDELVIKGSRVGQYDIRKGRSSVDDSSPQDACNIPFTPLLLAKRIRKDHEALDRGFVLAEYGLPQVALQVTEQSHLCISIVADLSVEDEVTDVRSFEFDSN